MTYEEFHAAWQEIPDEFYKRNLKNINDYGTEGLESGRMMWNLIR